MVRKSGRVKISSRDRIAEASILMRGKVGGGRDAASVAATVTEAATPGRRRRRRDSSASRTASSDGLLLFLLFCLLPLLLRDFLVAILQFLRHTTENIAFVLACTVVRMCDINCQCTLVCVSSDCQTVARNSGGRLGLLKPL